MTPKQYADGLTANLFKAADVYDEGTLNDGLIEGVDELIRHSLRNYWATNQQADLSETAFHAKSLMEIQKESGHHA